MKFSIITPTYNRLNLLPEAIDSVRTQTYKNWEMIIVDDGSTDATKEMVKRISMTDDRVYYHHQENQGACVARNTGMSIAGGDVIVYLDSDDVLHGTYLVTLYEHLRAHKTALYGASNHWRRIILVNEHGEAIAKREPFVAFSQVPTLKDFYMWNVKTTSSGVFHTVQLREEGFAWDPSIRRFQDWDFLLSIGVVHPDNFLALFHPLIDYRQIYGGNGMCSQATYKDWAVGFAAMYEKHKEDPLLQGQTWYPERVERYTTLHQRVLEGKEPLAVYKYFPDYKPLNQ